MTREQTLDASLIAEIESKAPKLSRTERENLISCLIARMKRRASARGSSRSPRCVNVGRT